MTALYKREGTSLFAGLTPLLLQWPLLSVMYLLFRSTQIGGKPNTLLTRDLFGVPLGSHWLAGAGPLSLHGLVFLGVFVLVAGLCWLSVRLGQLMMPPPAGLRRGHHTGCPHQGPAVPDRGDRGVRAARCRYLPARLHRVGAGRAGLFLAHRPHLRCGAEPAETSAGRA